MKRTFYNKTSRISPTSMKGKLRTNKTKPDVTRTLDPYALIREGSIELLEKLIDSDPKILATVRYPSGWSLMHRAAEDGQTDICQILLQRGLSVNVRTIWGWFTPLHLALGNGWKETALFLYHAGGDMLMKSKCQKNVLEYATHRGYDAVAKEFYFILQHERESKISQDRKAEKAERMKRTVPLTRLDEEEAQSLATWGGEGVVVDVDQEGGRISIGRESSFVAGGELQEQRSIASATSDITER